MPNIPGLSIAEIPEIDSCIGLASEASSFLSEIVWNGFLEPETVLRTMRLGHTVIAYESSAGLVAAGTLLLEEPDIAIVKSIGVLPGHRMQGIGRRVMGELEEIATEHGAALLELIPARGSEEFYKRLEYLGFRSDTDEFSIHKQLVK